MWSKGDTTALSGPLIAIAGSRKPADETIRRAKCILSICIDRNWCIVSGFAKGCDRIGHELAMKRKKHSIGILGSGLEAEKGVRYTAKTQQFIENKGCLISEYPPTLHTSPYRLVRRNRLIAALCHGIIILQAGSNSGTMHTARFALALGKSVATIRPPTTKSTYGGNQTLIDQGVVQLDNRDNVISFLNRLESASAYI